MSVPLIADPTTRDGDHRIPGEHLAVLLHQQPEPTPEAEPTPDRMASVTTLRPATEQSDTQPIPKVERHQAEEQPEPPKLPEAAPPAAAEPPAPPKPPKPPEPPETKPLTAPPRPTTDTRVDQALINAFHGVYILSVVIGLVGQIVGFVPVMGLQAAIIAGGAFELIMVTASTIGFSRIRNDHGWTEITFFLLVATFCATVASCMNFSHWAGLQSIFFGTLTAVGYGLHVISHLWTSIRTRKQLQAWKAAVAEIEAEKKRRVEAQQRAYDEWIADQERQQQEREAEQARKQREITELAARATKARSTSKPQAKTTSSKTAGKRYTDAELPGLVDAVLAAEDQLGEQLGIRRIWPMFEGMTQAQAKELSRLVRQQRPGV